MMRHCCWLVAALVALGCGESFTSPETATGGSNPGGTGGTTSGTGGGTTGGGGGGTAGGGGTTVESCSAANGIDNLEDGFDSDQLSQQWQPYGQNMALFLENGILRLNPAHGPVGVRSVERFNLRGCRIHIAITNLPNHADEPVEAWFELKGGDGDLMSIYVSEGHLRALVTKGGNEVAYEQVVYEPAQNRFWRFTEHAGDTALQIAGPDHQFSNVAVLDTPTFANDVEVELGTHAISDIIELGGHFGIAGVNTAD
ncbi:MAG: hypothetical protein JRI68_06295 [Deltaproteobacteria bacterium]|nr:hypothetical protein [Deltaproteobacteria bacterium]